MIVPDTIKHVGDAVSISAIVATLIGWLPHIAALLTVIWSVVRIYNEILDSQIKRKQKKKLDEQSSITS